MKRWWLAAGLVACGGMSPPRVLSIAPAQMRASDSLNSEVLIDGVVPFHVDYGSTAASADQNADVTLGGIHVGFGHVFSGGQLPIFVPSEFQPGAYDVRVTLDDGRSGTLAQAFTVTAGTWPSGYAFFPNIPDQQSGVPFTFTVQASGPNAGIFNGTVGLSLSGSATATLSPVESGPFVRGGLAQIATVSLDGGSQQVSIVVRDLNGTSAQSNAFRVTP